jgi:hypothetical protein
MFGKQNRSNVSEALEDFLHRSLEPLETNWERILFTFRLRTKKKPYTHWGMEQTYGEEAARLAIGQAHLEVVKNLLATGTPNALADLERYAAKIQTVPGQVVNLLEAAPDALPPSLSKPEVAHWSVELEALRALTKQ